MQLAQRREKARHKSDNETRIQLKHQLKEYCDIFTEGPICLGNGARIISKAMNMDGIIGDFLFDQKIVAGSFTQSVDQSGFSNMVKGNFDVRPGRMGLGSAAFFRRGSYLSLGNVDAYNSKEMTVVVWVYIRKLRKRGTAGVTEEQLCPIFLKGEDDPAKGQFKRGPGIFINQKTGTVYATVSGVDKPQGDSTRTLGYLKADKWNQVTAIFTAESTKIYLNGVLDGFGVHSSGQTKNNDTLYIGGHPNYRKNCSVELTIDSVKMYNRELHNYEIQAGVRTTLGIIEPSYFHLACFDCSYSEAKSKCVKNYKLCSSQDLYSGVWQAAHLMGWVEGFDTD